MNSIPQSGRCCPDQADIKKKKKKKQNMQEGRRRVMKKKGNEGACMGVSCDSSYLTDIYKAT